MYPEIKDPKEALKKYWGYDGFRSLQEEIIQAVLEKKDVLALLPTGGGKSVCFQIPIIVSPGMGLVISPLIALMKDQVMQLNKKGIPALAITSGMHIKEIDRELENCIYGKYKVLYVSPERLKSEMFKARAEKMNINLLAVDEAHCISQWGYDFRPSYMEIPEIKKIIRECPTLALTATATTSTREDIITKLELRKPLLLKKSFERKNLSYSIIYEEDKLAALKRILRNVPGSSVVYVRNRQKTEELAKLLQFENIKADFYHAGLPHYTRDKKQEDWISGKARVIVSTNAFGMGIDKPDVRTVIHIELPESLEEYYQEAGRAGRDEQKAYAVLLFNGGDPKEVRERFDSQYPPIETIRRIYHAFCNQHKIGFGSGLYQSFDLDLQYIANLYHITPSTIYHSLKRLEEENYVSLNEAVHHPSTIKFITDYGSLYQFQLDYPIYEPLIKLILRTTEGVFDNYVKVYETDISRILQMERKNVYKQFHQLVQYQVLEYFPETDMPKVTLLTPRLDISSIIANSVKAKELKAMKEKRLKAILDYATTKTECRSQVLLAYFDEPNASPCGQCDVCLNRYKPIEDPKTFDEIYKRIEHILKDNTRLVSLNGNRRALAIEKLYTLMPNTSRDKIQEVTRFLLDHNKIELINHKYICIRE